MTLLCLNELYIPCHNLLKSAIAFFHWMEYHRYMGSYKEVGIYIDNDPELELRTENLVPIIEALEQEYDE